MNSKSVYLALAVSFILQLIAAVVFVHAAWDMGYGTGQREICTKVQYDVRQGILAPEAGENYCG